MKSGNPPSVGLGGDGDEIAAVERIEARFGVKLDSSMAATWLTAGDIYRALCEKLPASARDSTETWESFALALTEETGVDPKLVEPKSPLLEAPTDRKKVALVIAVIVVLIAAGGILLQNR